MKTLFQVGRKATKDDVDTAITIIEALIRRENRKMTDKDFQKFMIEHMSKLSDDVTGIRQNLARLEFEHGEKLAALFDGQESIKSTLDDHAAILNKHTAVLDDHTAILNKHTAVLDDHTAILNKHTAVLDDHTVILNKHSAVLDDHTVTLNKHSAVLDDHTERLQRIEDKVEGHDIQIQVLDKTKSNKRKVK
ncbi:MAG: hypothetical protein WC147_03470 [Syntrophomonas sp.]